jgi:hypothetical protein
MITFRSSSKTLIRDSRSAGGPGAASIAADVFFLLVAARRNIKFDSAKSAEQQGDRESTAINLWQKNGFSGSKAV